MAYRRVTVVRLVCVSLCKIPDGVTGDRDVPILRLLHQLKIPLAKWIALLCDDLIDLDEFGGAGGYECGGHLLPTTKQPASTHRCGGGNRGGLEEVEHLFILLVF